MDGRLTETVIDEEAKVSYTFEATFAFMRRLTEDLGIEPHTAFMSFSREELNPLYVQGILIASLVSVDGEPVKPARAEEVVTGIIEKFGYSEAGTLAYHMLMRAWLGDQKKSRADLQEIHRTISEQLSPPFRLTSFVKAGWPWAVLSASFGVLGCVIFNFFVNLG